jgi:uncharacterized membrane protein
LTKSRPTKFSLLALLVLVVASSSFAQAPTPLKKPPAGPPAPQSKHYPILLLALGNDPSWSLRIGQKGPERLDRPAYPPITLEPAEVNREGTADSWTYRAKDTGTGVPLSVHLARELCTDPTSGTKYNFSAIVDHAQIGTLNGCARIAAELFPKIVNPANQSDDDEDPDKKKPPVETITNFKPPVAVAFLSPAKKVILKRGSVPHTVAPEGTQLALSHDGQRLLYTREDKGGRAIVLYDSTTGASTDLFTGDVQEAFWSPDDTRIAFMKFVDGKWHLWAAPASSPQSAAPIYPGEIISIHGWVDAHTILVDDLQQLSWVNEDGSVQRALPDKDIYGDSISSGNTVRVHPLNPDLLLVSAEMAKPASNSATVPKVETSLGFSLYEIRSKRRVFLSPLNMLCASAEWSRDGLQIFFTGTDTARHTATWRIFWDGTGLKRYMDGSNFVVGQ